MIKFTEKDEHSRRRFREYRDSCLDYSLNFATCLVTIGIAFELISSIHDRKKQVKKTI